MKKYKVAINLGEYTKQMLNFVENEIRAQGCSCSIEWDKLRACATNEMLRIIKCDMAQSLEQNEEA